MDPSIGPLTSADELLLHQTADTFAAVASTDLNWTERLWLHAATADGSLQISFGMGRYPNRGVMDGFGAVSRGTEQWTVRASRALGTSSKTAVGPINYEVVDPLRSARVRLMPSDVQPISFDVTVRGVVPARLEDREVLRAPQGTRVVNDVVRYHQAGIADGWVRVGSDRTPLALASSVAARDHSWGVRTQVGEQPGDLPPASYPTDLRSFTSWGVWTMTRDDGSRYGVFHYFGESNLPGQPARRLRGGVEHGDGSEESFESLMLDVRFDDTNRRFLGGTYRFLTADGQERPMTVTPVAAGTGFHLGSGLYFGLDGQRHGMWRGEQHVDGDHVESCDDPMVARRIHQHRDCVVRITDPVGGGTGTGTLQTIVIGGFPAYGLTAGSTFV